MDCSPSLKKAQAPQLAFAVALISAQLYLLGLPALAKTQPPEPEEISGLVGMIQQQDPTSLSPPDFSSPESLSDRSAQGPSTIFIYHIFLHLYHGKGTSSEVLNLKALTILVTMLGSLLAYSVNRREVIKITEDTLLIEKSYEDLEIPLSIIRDSLKLLMTG